jgi:flavin-dependent dehydrogenase
VETHGHGPRNYGAQNYDLIVAGAGPAGAACAITARRGGARVLLLEKDHFPRHKVCGEFVSPESLGLLEWLLGETKFQGHPAVGSSRIFYKDRQAQLPIAPAARSVSRSELDFELLQTARRAGVQAEEGVAIQKVERAGAFMVTTTASAFTASAVVNATGRWSQLGRPAGDAKKNREKWIGVKAHFTEDAPPLSVDLYFFDGGYCGVTPMSDKSVNACALVRADVARSLDDVLTMHPELRRRSRDWQPLFTPLTTSGVHFQPPQTESAGMMLAGDAAAFIDPYTGDGISLALHSGTLAGRALLPFLKGEATLDQAHIAYRESYFRHLAPAFRHSAWVRRVLTAPPWIRSIAVGLAGVRPLARALVSRTRVRGTKEIIEERKIG